MAAMLVASAMPAFAQNNVSQTCEQFGDLGVGTHGGCVSFLASPVNLDTASGADWCRDPANQERLGKNHGHCVTFFAK